VSATRADHCVVACAEAFRGDGEIVASPMGTVPRLGALLAKTTFEPGLLLTDGEAYLLAEAVPLGAEADAPREGWLPFRQVFDVVAAGARHVMMGASQLDRFGNQNISAIGDWSRPKVQLLGARGAPGNTANHATSYWVASHSPRVFVEEVDFASGIGSDRARRAGGSVERFHEIRAIVTDLGVLDLGGPDGTVQLVAVHPGVAVEDVQIATGFDLAVADEVATTRAPTSDELDLIAWLDPDDLRHRDVPKS
jgi:acyl CoA:acetate/3-ketoacid CoA transferase beta subunit